MKRFLLFYVRSVSSDSCFGLPIHPCASLTDIPAQDYIGQIRTARTWIFDDEIVIDYKHRYKIDKNNIKLTSIVFRSV